MIPNKENKDCRYLVVKRQSAFLKEITSKHHGDFIVSEKKRQKRKKNL